MVDVDIYVINDEEYYLIDELEIKGTSYLYLSKVEDEEFFMFRKRDKDDPEVLVTLDNEEEVKMVALVFANKVLG
ncbi:MAG: DUF1292 domain-containing protein [Bacilli bacterium]|nr:DUF1292 domain-containing protein [Bacilli bacterium]